jgi:hypothetical protein
MPTVANAVRAMERLAAAYRQLGAPRPDAFLLHLTMWLNNQSACLADLLVHGQTTWMQTTGTTLVAVERCSLLRMWMSAKGSRRARRLLYLVAVLPAAPVGR